MTCGNSPERVIFLPANLGRTYELGALKAIFKADEEETDQRYSVSEWLLEPYTDGPGVHSHDNNHDIFYILEGSASILIGDAWVNAPSGSFIRIPANTKHDFKNTTAGRVKLLNFFIPGGFEHNMPSIVQWFTENRPAMDSGMAK